MLDAAETGVIVLIDIVVPDPSFIFVSYLHLELASRERYLVYYSYVILVLVLVDMTNHGLHNGRFQNGYHRQMSRQVSSLGETGHIWNP